MRGRLLVALALALAGAFPAAAQNAAAHRDAILRLMSISTALREEARAGQAERMLAMDLGSRMPAPECAELLQDLVSMRNVQAVGAADGELQVKWHGKRELVLRARPRPAFALEVHDKAGPACTVTSVAAREHGEWQGKLTPMLLALPGEKSGKPRVFPVAVDRAPRGQPLAKE
jgi:hypothetical protein